MLFCVGVNGHKKAVELKYNHGFCPISGLCYFAIM